ncbi:MAG: phage tail sheath subtilisin-like domain-containing protein, partial [Chloroflexota bacterium]|nr:phage tail sheath subtilisin-like domain-containing protein [Chloroflexota bacterium]
ALQAGDIISFGVEGPYNTPDAIALAEKGQKYKVVSYASTSLTLERYPKSNAKGLKTAIDGSGTAVQINRYWQYWDQFDGPPGTSTWMKNKQGGLTTGKDEMHIIVIDNDGGITGAPGTILEKHSNLSKMLGAVTDSGDNNYWADALYLGSNYIYWMDHPTGATNWGTEPDTSTPSTSTAALLSTVGHTNVLTGGVGGVTPTEGERALAFDRFADADSVDFNLLISGPATVGGAAGTAHAIDLIDLVEKRKDSVVFLSPYTNAVVNVANAYQQVNNVTGWADSLPSSSYAVFDSGYKKMYDKYNDVFRWVPLNADIAGACARTDAIEDPWWSPGGLSRGQIRGAVELALNPTQTERDALYRSRVNPVVTFPGEGTVLWGDKTALAQTSAFDRINVRRLFITIEEAIAAASRTVLFEFNDVFTREGF